MTQYMTSLLAPLKSNFLRSRESRFYSSSSSYLNKRFVNTGDITDKAVDQWEKQIIQRDEGYHIIQNICWSSRLFSKPSSHNRLFSQSPAVHRTKKSYVRPTLFHRCQTKASTDRSS